MALSTPARALAGLRIVVGASAWVAPNLAGRLFGLDPDGNPQASYLARLFGVRDVALSAGVLSTEGEARALWLKLGVACDAADVVAGLLAGRRGVLPAPAAALCTGTALAAAALGAVALAQSDEPSV